MAKFIVIRGPSGAGKTTVSKMLQAAYPERSLLLHEDSIRFMFSNWKEPSHTATKELMVAMVLSGLASGFDVIYEGISNIKTYAEYFQRIFDTHPNDNYFFYLDIDFDESIKRHDTRPEKAEFGINEMKKWREYATPTGFTCETIIPQESSAEATVASILKALVTPD
jgi:adenylate kinase family enzyme